MSASARRLLCARLVAVALAAPLAALSAVPAHADEAAPPGDFTVTGTVTLASQYRFRGLSQSANQPVVQGGITIDHVSGFYLGVWASSAPGSNFAKSPIDLGGSEVDIYGGYTRPLGAFTLDGGVHAYLYPDFPKVSRTARNTYELYGSVAAAYGPVRAKLGLNFAPAQKVFNIAAFSPTRSNTYVYGDLTGDIPGTPLTLHGHLGYTSGGLQYVRPYVDYAVGISATYRRLTLDASVVGTDIGRSRIAGSLCGGACAEYTYRPAKPVGVVSLTAAF